MSFKVAILGNQENEAQWMSHYGIQVFDLSADQICSLLHNPDPSKGIDIAKLGAVPITQYQLMGGGRFFPSVTREEIAQVMQGVDVMIMMLTNAPWIFNYMAQDFYNHLIGDNLLDQCKAVVLRIVPWKTDNDHLQRNFKPIAVEEVLTNTGLDKASSIKEKLYVLADKEVQWQRSRRSARKNKKLPKLDADVVMAISQLRSRLLGEEVKEAVVKPVKETMSAGKALINMGQRFSTWISSLVKS